MSKRATETRMERLKALSIKCWDYYNGGVWQDTRNRWWISLVKIVNLTVRGFMSGDLQSKACAMTYRTLLAIVPMLALLFAIGRGFGLQDLLMQELYDYLPSQRRVLEVAFKFVDSYISQASEGIFVGVGIVFLLWTLVGLLGNVEDIFNAIFNVKKGRSLWRKLADYTAILLVLPVMMICASGISIFMTTALHKFFNLAFLTPVIGYLLDGASYVLTWLFFAGSYALIPNTKVKFKNALIAGILAGIAFQVLQWLFLTGQMYVAKYNAIYGSFSFLPLLLIWLQLTWLTTFICAGICYSSQNIFRYSFDSNVAHITVDYRLQVEIAMLAVIVGRFQKSMKPVSGEVFISGYGLPPRMVDIAIEQLRSAGLVSFAVDSSGEDDRSFEELPLQPSENIDNYTLIDVVRRLTHNGDSDFIPGFKEEFAAVKTAFADLDKHIGDLGSNANLASLSVPLEPIYTAE